MTPDVNVLLAALRVDHPQHTIARTWLERALVEADRGAPLVLLPMVIAGTVRLATHPKIFREPTPAPAVAEFFASLQASGSEVGELGREIDRFLGLVADHALQANDVPDAWIAAAVLAADEHLVTFDRGFARWLGRTSLTMLDT